MSIHLCVSAAEFKVILDRDRVLCYRSASGSGSALSPDEARWLWIYFKTVHHSQDLLSSTFDSVYYFNVIHIYVGFNVS